MAAALAAGCADRRVLVPPAAPPTYRAGCGDVLAVGFAGRPGWDGTACVAADGTLPLGPLGRVPVEQLSDGEIQAAVAQAAGLSPEAVAVSVAEPRAGVAYLRHGGRLRRVSLPGPDTVAGVLNRAGVVAVRGVRLSRGSPPTHFPAGFDTPVEAGDVVTTD
jgi:protein involved in polysaccharide export with SLBB domain